MAELPRSSVPIPDPSKLTTDAVALMKAEVVTLFDVKLGDFKELVNEQFKGRDTALAAALKSAQEASDKAASGASKTMDELSRRIDELKERFTEDRGSTAGGRKETIQGLVQLVTTVTGIIAIIGAIIATRPHP